MKPARGLLLLVVLITAAAHAQVTPAVYVTFDKRETLSKSKRRELADSARDVREQLQKRKAIRPAEAERDADVLVTILDRRLEVKESGRNEWGGALSQTHYQSRYIVAFRLRQRRDRRGVRDRPRRRLRHVEAGRGRPRERRGGVGPREPALLNPQRPRLLAPGAALSYSAGTTTRSI